MLRNDKDTDFVILSEGAQAPQSKDLKFVHTVRSLGSAALCSG